MSDCGTNSGWKTFTGQQHDWHAGSKQEGDLSLTKRLKLVTRVVSLTMGIVFTGGLLGCVTHLDRRQAESSTTNIKTPLGRSQEISAATAPLKLGTNEIRLEHDGHRREMLVRLPDDYDPAKRYPVVFGFHGAGGAMEAYHRHLEPLVREHGMISVSPQGISTTARCKTAWNGFENHRYSNTDDVGFVAKTIDYLDTNASIDRDRLFATGGSSGAIFCFRLAMETDLFAAIAPMRGAMIKRPSVPRDRPKLSILLACGTEDDLFTGNTKIPSEVFYPAHETMSLWAANHGAGDSSPTTLEDSDRLVLTRYSPADAPYELLLYAVKGSGHKLPKPQLEKAIGFMGEFFSRHKKADTRK